MSINIHIEKKDLWLLSAIVVFLVGVGYVIAYRSGASPSVMGHSAEELEGVCKSDGTGCPVGLGGGGSGSSGGLAFGDWVDISFTPVDGSSQTPFSSDGFIVAYGNSYNSIIIDSPDGIRRCKLELGHGNDRTGNMCPIKKGDTWSIWSNVAGGLTIYWLPIVSGGRNSMTFEVYNSDTTTYECVEKNLTDFCGDEDGCDIRVLMQHETEPNDDVRIIDEHIFMEQSSMSNNRNSGTYGWTRQSGGGDHSWITGTNSRYTMFSPWDWVWMTNYRHDWCPGQAGDGPAYSDHYTFNFMSHRNVRARFIVYD